MSLSKFDIEKLDKVIYALSGDGLLSTIPEILDGYSKFPRHGSEKDSTYRHYEDILVENAICSIQDDWKPNSVFAGFKTLIIESAGRRIVRNKWSISNFLEEKERKNKPLPTNNITIYGNGNSGIFQDSSLRDFDPKVQSSNPNNDHPTDAPHKKSNQDIWEKAKTVATILAFGTALIGLVTKLLDLW